MITSPNQSQQFIQYDYLDDCIVIANKNYVSDDSDNSSVTSDDSIGSSTQPQLQMSNGILRFLWTNLIEIPPSPSQIKIKQT
jgi:hypothetical protein